MLLPDPPEKYTVSWLRNLLNILNQADQQNLKRGQVNDQLMLKSPDGASWRATIDNAGTVTWTKVAR